MSVVKDSTERLNKIKGTLSEKSDKLLGQLNNYTSMFIIKFKEYLSSSKEEMSQNRTKYVILIVICLLVMIYFIVFFRRISRFLNRMNRPYSAISPRSLIQDLDIKDKDYHLSDFWIASSYKSYLPCTNYLDVSSIKSIEKILKYGCRYIDLDVMNKTLAPCSEPVVCNGIEVGSWHTTTCLSFDKVIEFISSFAFSNEVPNKFDPLFLNINFNTWYNKQTIDKCAATIKKYLSSKLLGDIYNYKIYNAGQLHISKLLEGDGRVVIMTTSDISHTNMEHIVNIGSPNIVSYDHTKFLRLHGLGEIKRRTGHTLMRVTPSFKSRKKQNYNYLSAYSNGVQFICMNYTEPDKWMKIYINMFKDYSLVLKPQHLRGTDGTPFTPTPQTPELKMLDKEKKLNFWEILY